MRSPLRYRRNKPSQKIEVNAENNFILRDFELFFRFCLFRVVIYIEGQNGKLFVSRYQRICFQTP
jgi:hypothetical protein